jgi:hypothetical protein
VKEVANPYNALQAFTTNALCDAELEPIAAVFEKATASRVVLG